MSEPKTKKEMLLNDKFLNTPDMGDYLDVDMTIDAAKKVDNSKEGPEFFVETPFQTAPGYYSTENVIILTGKPSFRNDGSEAGKSGLNRTDGDTVYLEFREMNDGGRTAKFNTTDEPMTPLQFLKKIDYIVSDKMNYLEEGDDESSILDKDQLGIRILGINAPELPHFRTMTLGEKDNNHIKVPVYFCKYGDLKNHVGTTIKLSGHESASYSHIQYMKYTPTSIEPRKDDDVLAFIKTSAKNPNTDKYEDYFYEIVDAPIDNQYVEEYIDGKKEYNLLDKIGTEVKVVLKHDCDDPDDTEYFKQAIMAQQDVIRLINNASEVVYMLDESSIVNKAKGQIPFEYKKEYEKISSNPWYAFKSLWQNFTQQGQSAFQQMYKRYFGQEVNGRFLGAIYVKCSAGEYGDQWINLAKYLIWKYPEMTALPSYSNDAASDSEYNNVSDAFKMWTYDKSKIKYIDALNNINTDDRAEIQNELTGCDLEQLKNYTVMIGDCLFMIPPTSIRVVNQTKNERISMIRAKGTTTKTLPKTETVLEIDLYFNGNQDINGIPYSQTTPSGQKMTYYMNGLRALIAQYKFTPFLPITNYYINYVLNIEAVTLVSYNISTVPNFPRTLKATIRLQDFDYRQYMPEILPPNLDEKEAFDINLYAKTINWPVFRYYYQRCIDRGNILSNYEFNSQQYIDETVGQKTALQKVSSMSSSFDLYVADEEFLKQRKMLKMSLENNPIESNITFSNKEEDFLKNLAKIYVAIRKGMNKANKDIMKLTTLTDEYEDCHVCYFFDNTVQEKLVTTYDDYNKDVGICWNKVVEKNKANTVYEQARTTSDIFDSYMPAIKEDFLNELTDDLINNCGVKECNFVIIQEIPDSEGVINQMDDDFYCNLKIGIQLSIDFGQSENTQTKDKLKRLLAKEMNVEVDEIFKDDHMFVGYTSSWKRNPQYNGHAQDVKVATQYLDLTSNFAQDDDDNDFKALTYLASSYGAAIDDKASNIEDDMWTVSNDLAKMKDNIDLETNKSMKFDKYEIGHPLIQNISFIYNNTFTNTNLKIYDGFASQYTGGSDTSIEISMISHDEYTVNQLNALSRICTQRIIDYRKIISSSPLRIDSELTRLMGINEIIIESVDIATVPNFPNVWEINLKVTSVERTLRNREAMKKLDSIKNTTTGYDNLVKIKNYFDIKNTLAKVELYPDLELPTIKELEKLGYYYIQYKNQPERVFPDADFYFSYLHLFSSQMLRETIVNYFAKNKNKEFYRKYAGDLLSNDEGMVKYRLDEYGNIYASAEKSDDSDISEDILSEDQKAIYNDVQKGSNKLQSYILSNNNNQFFKDAQNALNADTNGAEQEKSDTAKKTQDILDETNKIKNSLLSLSESIETTTCDSFELENYYRLSVNSSDSFGQAKDLLSRYKDIKKYEYDCNHGVSISDDSTNDIQSSYNKSLSEVILSILSKPIDYDAKYSVFNSKDYDEFWNVLIKEILNWDKGKFIAIDLKDEDGEANGTDASDAEDKVESENLDASKSKKSLLYTLEDIVKEILEACARGATAEFGIDDVNTEDRESYSTKPRYTIKKTEFDENSTTNKELPYVLTPESGQGLNTYTLAETDEQRKNGVIFGGYGIKKYSPSVLSVIYGIEITSGKNGFLDPYYNYDLLKPILLDDTTDEKAVESRQETYIKGITTDPSNGNHYAQHAFFRIMLCWLYKFLTDGRNSMVPKPLYLAGLIDDLLKDTDEANANDVWYNNAANWLMRKGLSIYDSFKTDNLENIFANNQQKKQDEIRMQVEAMDAKAEMQTQAEKMEKNIRSELPRLKFSLLSGMLLTTGFIALTDFDTPVYTAIRTGNLDTLVSYISELKGTILSDNNLSDSDLKIRRALQFIFNKYSDSDDSKIRRASQFIFNNGNSDKKNLPSAIDQYNFQSKSERVYLKCAEIPNIYLMHSFYDMVTTDMRGRMARAFPTYYMLLIDEGRDMGVWRIQDNFYDVSSITEFQVVKSRKIAADTAKICMTNLFGTFTTEDDDIKDEYQYTFRDVFNSVFNPHDYFNKEYERYSEARDINRAKLRAGARVSLRMGYSANAAALPVMFNGTVAEVEQGDIMTIICQGDGVELANPAMFASAADAKDVADLENNDKLLSSFLSAFDDRTTPRDILLNPLIAEGTWIQELIKNWSKGRLFNANPFGIVHFGDKHFNTIFTKNGEVEQNIYEALSTPSWSDSIDISSTESKYALSEAPKLRVLLDGKSYWDLMNIAAAASPDYIAAIVPFQMRSSIFFGAPRYYYAYDYVCTNEGGIAEKRKPFQQYHIYTSYTDIIADGITTSEKDIRTVAIGTYTSPGLIYGTNHETVGPLFLDIDIYPEKQKTTYVECNFQYKGFNLPFTIPGVEKAKNEWSSTGGYQTAWRITASKLKDTVKDMYKGELIIMGDPSVKPYDKIYINDTYEDIQGMFDVESVTQTFSVETGFTTSITPDCSVAIDNKYESIASTSVKEMITPFLTTYIAMVAYNRMFSNIVRSMFLGSTLAIDKATSFASGAVNTVKNVLGKENLSTFAPYTSKFEEKIGMVFNVTPIDLKIYKSVSKLSTAYKDLAQELTLASGTDIANMIQKIIDLPESVKKLDPSELSELLNNSDLSKINKAFDTVSGSKKANAIKDAQKSAKELKDIFNKKSSTVLNSVSLSKNDLNTIINEFKEINKNAELTSDVQKALKNLESIKNGISYATNPDKALEALKDLKTLSSNFNDLSEGSEALKIFNSMNNNVLKGTASSLKDFENIEETFKAVNSIQKGAVSFKSLLAKNLIMMAIDVVLTKSVQEFIERKLKNLQVLTVFPLFHNGKVLTAGLDGNKGSVVGSPTWNEPGWLEQQCIDFFNYRGHSLGGEILAGLRDIFITTPEMLKAVNDYKRDNGYTVTNGSSDVQRTSEINNLLGSISKQEISGFNAYKQLYFDARVTSSTKQDGLAAYAKYRFVDYTEEDLRNKKDISSNLKRIDEDDLIKRLTNNGVFKFITDKTVTIDNTSDSSSIETSNDNFVVIPSVDGKEELQVPCKKIKNGNDAYPTIVIPYLRPDALIVLNYVVEEICKIVQPDYQDENCEFEYLHKHNMVLHNAVMINETSWMNTGFGFVLEVKDWDGYDNFIKSLLECDERIQEGGAKDYKLLEIRKDKIYNASNIYDFWVAPRIVGRQENANIGNKYSNNNPTQETQRKDETDLS